MATALLDPPSAVILEDIATQCLIIEAELNRRRWLIDSNSWVEERLGDQLWSGQRAILRSVARHRKTAAPTCHGVGKSFSAADAAAWWLDTHLAGEAFVITTAPTQPQVKVILWKEIGRAHQRGNLAGRVNQMEWLLKVGTREEIVAMGRKPNDYSPTAFQGIHAAFVLIIVDEANGVRGQLWHAIDSLMMNDNSKLLEIGNPDDPTGEFYEHCKPGSGYNVVHISAFDSPNFTSEDIPQSIKQELIGRTYVEERRAKWARTWTWQGNRVVPPPDGNLEDTHPFWQSKVLGQFPVQSAAGSLIPLAWIRAAQERTLTACDPSELGLDVGASEDGDPTCCGHRRGPVFRVLYEERQPDTMKTTGKLLQHLHDPLLRASRAKVDYIGVGRGVVDRSKEQQEPVFPIQVGEAATRHSCKNPKCMLEWDEVDAKICPKCKGDRIMKVFANLLSQLWWDVRTLFEVGEIDLDSEDEDLAAELLTIRWEPNSNGQIKVVYGDGPSPNRADSLLMAYAPVMSTVTTKYIPGRVSL